jgi:hypothetical protein
LFFLVTEEYIEGNRQIAGALGPLLTQFGQDLGHVGAIVKPFDAAISKTLEEVLNRKWIPSVFAQFNQKTPGLLVIDTDFKDFDPTRDPYLFISLRDSMDEFGNMKVFEVKPLLTALSNAAERGDLFQEFRKYHQDQQRRKAKETAWQAVEMKPGIFGFSINLKLALSALGRFLGGGHKN